MRFKINNEYYRLNWKNIGIVLGTLAFLLVAIWMWRGISEGVACNFDRSQISWWNPLHIRDFFGIQ